MFTILYLVDVLICIPVLMIGFGETVWAVVASIVVSFVSRANEHRTVTTRTDRHAFLVTALFLSSVVLIPAFLLGEPIVVLPAFLSSLLKYSLPQGFLARVTRPSIEKLDPGDIDTVKRLKKRYDLFKRIVDVFVAICLLVLLSPFLLIAVIVVMVHSGRPAIIVQRRIGRAGKDFMMLKLRTFSSRNGVHAVNGVGKLLRPLRIDEIPQLVNVLKGDMSIVGPRPELPDFHQMGVEHVPNYESRLLVNPGLTGWAQINYKYTTTPGEYMEKTLYDLFYVKNRSLLIDLKCMAKTPHALVKALLARKE